MIILTNDFRVLFFINKILHIFFKIMSNIFIVWTYYGIKVKERAFNIVLENRVLGRELNVQFAR